MTTGNITVDNTVVTPSASGNGLVGFKRTRDWSGADYPATPKQYIEYYEEVFKPYREYNVLSGKSKIVYRQEYKLKRKRIYNRPPKRARTVEHPYTMSLQEWNYRIWDQRNNPSQSYTPNRLGWDQYLHSTQNVDWTSNDDLRLLGKLREKVAGSSFNAGIFLGEGREALSMITNAATRIYWGYRAMKRGDLRSARRYLVDGTDRSRKTFLGNREVANNWLELQYGWLPLLNDVVEGAEFLSHHLTTPLQHVIRVGDFKTGSVRLINSSTAPIWQEAVVRKNIKCILKEKDVASLSGLTDPLSVAWELMPYSFIIDWFIPVGNYLSARGLSSALTGTFVTSTKKVYAFRGLVGGQPSVYGPSHAKSPCEQATQKKVSFTRTVDTTLSIPKPEVKPLGSVFSWRRAANAVSLLTQLGFKT